MRQRGVFDIVGPVVIGPSSSRTAGAVRLGTLAEAIFGTRPNHARVLLYGSFASTRAGNGTDLAIVATASTSRRRTTFLCSSSSTRRDRGAHAATAAFMSVRSVAAG